MSKFSLQHYKEVADVIRDWIRLNPEVQQEFEKEDYNFVDSLINGFILTFLADNIRFDRRKFEEAVKEERI